MREIRTLRAMWRALETVLRKLLTGHEDGNVGYGQGVSFGCRASARPYCHHAVLQSEFHSLHFI